MKSKNINEATIDEIVNVFTLQNLQDSFVAMLDIAILVTDHLGNPITLANENADFCNLIMENSELGRKLCVQCMKNGAQKACEQGRSVLTFCHAGLCECHAPIICEGRLMGTVVCIQLTPSGLTEEQIITSARDLGIDDEQLIKKALKIKNRNQQELNKCLQFVQSVSDAIAQLLADKYSTWKVTQEIVSAGTAKSDFLANMSHEIRTPMNAVIGMAEMALRFDMPDEAKGYINQIKTSGRALLTLINDILDYSKIESGKMELTEVEYEPVSLFHDISGVVATRLMDKDVELLLDYDPSIPYKLYGDDLRIRQVIINLANNATKFTNTGHVLLKVEYKRKSEDAVNLKVSVKDTGIGIKEEDMSRLFSSFQQLDSKRNRNVEGTGLGLAICQQLINLMDGSMSVESKYGEGSTFSFEIPQKIVDITPSVQVEDPSNYTFAGFFENSKIADEFKQFSSKLEIAAINLSNSENPYESIEGWQGANQHRKGFVIIEERAFNKMDLSTFDSEIFDKVQFVILAGTFSDTRKWKDNSRFKVIRKPLTVHSLYGLVNQEKISWETAKNESDASFEAPEAEVLIVDDNMINLTVAEGLLEPLKMKISTAVSGKAAIELIENKQFDLIFMDHMMPEMDGVETTRIIRRMYPSYDKVPIIALTANAVGGTKEMFLKEGMNDFVAKPIEVRVLMSKVRQWLPADKIQRVSDDQSQFAEDQVEIKKIPDVIGDLDVSYAKSMLGAESLFWKVLQDYYRVIESKADTIEQTVRDENWLLYTTEVHALKSASKQIGAMELSEMALKLEKAGKERTLSYIRENTAAAIEKYRSYIPVLKAVLEDGEEDTPKEPVDMDFLKESLVKLKKDIEDFETDDMEAVIEELKTYSFPEELAEKFNALEEAVYNLDMDIASEIIDKWNEN